ncbi:MAG: tRNA uridine-5-carboxymethylaminomethyl(34) synthesis GTPase MnmE [Francisellaceae bacterium]|jgi:tRNA modification GTPase|nr:tRNA uridine-5-carboxymethylaminomethyl(34) synthesis GTPase MnmE [Francisellaceae bacterium]
MESLVKQKIKRPSVRQNSGKDTIAAIATPGGYAGVGIIRLSGDSAYRCALKITKKTQLKPRYAHFSKIFDLDGEVVDEAVVIFFPGPNSFTGEDVVELQAHGSPVVLEKIVKILAVYGARMANPGEFSKRAFLNEKIDLVQAEAVLDLIHAQSESAAKAAVNSLQGVFSSRVAEILDGLVHTRVYLEASLDFSEEDIGHETRAYIERSILSLNENVELTLAEAKNGCVLSQGIKTAIVGPPNAGKSSFFNCLTMAETAIVSSVAGTTRDLVRENITLEEISLNLSDTAGIRLAGDEVEQIGIKKARGEITKAQLVVVVLPVSSSLETDMQKFLEGNKISLANSKVIVVVNKVDLMPEICKTKINNMETVYLSALTGVGVKDFVMSLRRTVLVQQESAENTFTARTRHVDALELTLSHLQQAQKNVMVEELCAEELKLAQMALNEITGKYSSDNLLGDIFANFCIGK